MIWVERDKFCHSTATSEIDGYEQWYILADGPDHSFKSHGGVYRRSGVWMYIVAGFGYRYEEIPAVTSLEEAKAYVEALVRMQ